MSGRKVGKSTSHAAELDYEKRMLEVNAVLTAIHDACRRNPGASVGQILAVAAVRAHPAPVDLFYVTDEELIVGLRRVLP
jgi:hypothetical protein